LVIRHRQTKENLAGIIQGKSIGGTLADQSMDSELLQWCEEHIEGSALILASSALRCEQSARSIADALHLPLEITPLLAQRGWGDVEGKNVKDLGKMFVKNAFFADTDALPFGAESLREIRERAVMAWVHIKAMDATTVIVITHDEFSNYLVNEIIHEGLFKRSLAFGEAHMVELVNGSVARVMLHQSMKSVSGTYFVLLRDDARDFLMDEVGVRILNNRGIALIETPCQEIIEGIIIGDEPFTDHDLQHYPNLKVVARFGKGIDNVQITRDQKVVVANTPGCNEDAVAEFTMGIILNTARNIFRAVRDPIIMREWIRPITKEKYKTTIGIAGLGVIGQAVAEAAQKMNFPIVGWTFHPERHWDFIRGKAIQMVESPLELCAAADIVTIHTRASRASQGLFGLHELEAMKARKGFLINTARASIVDYEAIAIALKNGWVSGAALDVWPEEPIKSEWLKNLACDPSVIATSHIAGRTETALYKAVSLCAYNIAWVLLGRPELATSVAIE